jgi:hypothetical protein
VKIKALIPGLPAVLLVFAAASHAQMITGVWKGRINKQKVEVKIIQSGDTLLGTSYYYESPSSYRRYSIKGFFEDKTNMVVWWDDQLLEEKAAKISLSVPGKIPMLNSADFNCPGDGRMMIEGKTVEKDKGGMYTGDVKMDKVQDPVFPDEWDYIIENYTVGANDPDVIDSVARIASRQPEEKIETVRVPPVKEDFKPAIMVQPVQSIEQKFTTRKKKLTAEIPVTGDSIELRFYDNAEIDGDSISLFLNDVLIFSHIRLAANAYTIKLPVAEMKQVNELTMVAENLGAIPPNTSFMVAIVGEKRYEARLESTEGSSAMIRLVK